jgi:small redox-active disulfide protein 2
MSLFGKKKEVNEKPACDCNGEVVTYEASSCCCGSQSTENCCGGDNKVTSIKVLGAGCKSCHEQYENAKKATEELGLGIEVEYITDLEKVMAYGVMSMPAIVVNENVVSMGKVLKPAEVIKLLGKLGF